jgi:sugar lactone lactonase YvrE
VFVVVGSSMGGCGGGSKNTSGGTRGNGQIGTITAAANDSSFTSPFDATPSPDGSMVYFTAIGADGSGGVFSASPSGGHVQRLDSGGILVSPSGITIGKDGQQLFIADPAVDNDTSGKFGAIFVLPVAGGTPAVLPGTEGFDPRGVDAGASTLYFTGGPAAASGPGVYSTALAGGRPAPIVTGAPFVNPSGLCVAQSGDVYVADTLASASRAAAIIKISGGQAMLLVEDLGVGHPAGITLVQDESALLVSGLDPATQTDLVYRIDLGAMPHTSTFSKAISAYSEPAGLHRAAEADIYAWADGLANSTGTVYVLSR